MRTQKQKQRFLFLYRIYFIASLIPLAVFLQLTAYFYLSAFREYVTISHLFLLALLLGFTMYLRNKHVQASATSRGKPRNQVIRMPNQKGATSKAKNQRRFPRNDQPRKKAKLRRRNQQLKRNLVISY